MYILEGDIYLRGIINRCKDLLGNLDFDLFDLFPERPYSSLNGNNAAVNGCDLHPIVHRVALVPEFDNLVA